MFSRVWGLFCNVDGNYLRDTYKYPFATGQSPKLMSEWDKLSCQDRLDEIRDRLSKEEQAMLIAVIEQMGGNSLDKLGLLDALRWWSLGGNTPTGLNDIGLHTRLASGNSTLHRRIFEHAESTGNLSYSFSTAVERIVESDGVTTVETRGGRAWRARAVVCTVPLNVLSSIQFSPPLPGEKLEALQQTSANLCNKVHVDLDGPDYLSWSSFGSPGQGLVAMLADRLTPAGNTHLVGFGPDPTATNGMNLKDMSAVKEAVLHLLPKNDRDRQNISRIVKSPFANSRYSLANENNRSVMIGTMTNLQRAHGVIFPPKQPPSILPLSNVPMVMSTSQARIGLMAGEGG